MQERTAELRESEARYRRLTELASAWYWEQAEHGTFTKEEFLAMVPEKTKELGHITKMPDPIHGKAWWNEFMNKHKVFTIQQ